MIFHYPIKIVYLNVHFCLPDDGLWAKKKKPLLILNNQIVEFHRIFCDSCYPDRKWV